MLDSGIDVQLAARQADTSDMVRFKRQMDALKERLAGPDAKDQRKQLHQACEKFEAVFISKLWQEMRKTVPREGYLHAKQEEQYLSMFDKDFAEKMASSGGLGLADLIYDQLSEKLKNTSRDTLSGGVEIKPLHQDPIALNAGKGPIPLAEPRTGITLEQWAGGASGTAGTGGADATASDATVTDAAAGVAADTSGSRPLSDVEVKARLETLVRHLEAERIKSGLLGADRAAKTDGTGRG